MPTSEICFVITTLKYSSFSNTLAISYCNMTCHSCSSIAHRINPIYEMIYEIKKTYNVSRNGWFDLEFDAITVTNPNGTVSLFTNSYPYLLQPGTFTIMQENFGDVNSVMIGIRYDTIHTIGNGTTYNSNNYFFFRYKIGITEYL